MGVWKLNTLNDTTSFSSLISSLLLGAIFWIVGLYFRLKDSNDLNRINMVQAKKNKSNVSITDPTFIEPIKFIYMFNYKLNFDLCFGLPGSIIQRANFSLLQPALNAMSVKRMLSK